MKEPPRCIHRAIGRDPVLLTDDVVLLPMPRSRVYRAGALLQRHMVAEDSERVALQKGMPEDRGCERRTLKLGDSPMRFPSTLVSCCAYKIVRDDIYVVANLHR